MWRRNLIDDLERELHSYALPRTFPTVEKALSLCALQILTHRSSSRGHVFASKDITSKMGFAKRHLCRRLQHPPQAHKTPFALTLPQFTSTCTRAALNIHTTFATPAGRASSCLAQPVVPISKTASKPARIPCGGTQCQKIDRLHMLHGVHIPLAGHMGPGSEIAVKTWV
jgi:hypothetical protein